MLQAFRIIYVVFRLETEKKSGGISEIQTFCRFILEQDTGLEPAAYCLGSKKKRR
nr:MAG TPA: hypothetical protein [Caudoviricetes sp.]